ncbi:MAG TPA: formylglycine-generating enzyme family protein [Chthonomonadaceae bacterium]|nr:formylglycine-generating enzyme family protein [Chthonomonadaceae bacterium]
MTLNRFLSCMTVYSLLASTCCLCTPVHPQAKQPESGRTGGSPTKTKINPKDGAEMILIPAGPFLMGDTLNPDNPPRTVTLPGYYIYKYPVTVKQYMKFCKATGHDKPEEPSFGWHDDNPVVNVSWDEAKAYCMWAGMKLPTDAQWEKAARGTDGRKFPWGKEWDASKSVNSVGKEAMRTESVYSHPEGMSPYGVMHMNGNVSQWCEDKYRADDDDARVLRGGSWAEQGVLDASYRGAHGYTVTSSDIGFRCAARQ